MPVSDKIGGQWRPVQRMYDKVGGQWRPVKGEWVKQGGQWRQTFNGNFGVHFQEYLQNPERIVGSYTLKRDGGELVASITGYTGGENQGAAIGWMIRNIPIGVQVAVTFEVYKGSYPMNDVIVSSAAGGVIGTYSSSTGTITAYYPNHGGWLNFVLNFFPTQGYATTSYVRIKRVEFGNELIFPS